MNKGRLMQMKGSMTQDISVPAPAGRKLAVNSGGSQRFILKACIFATGLAGIVAEYVMSTLASYLLGNAVLQWTLVVSIMLFAMGLGSRLSKYIYRRLLEAFILLEFALSLLCATSAMLAYFLTAYIQNIALLIYFLAFCIGLLIGLEIPLATRLNDVFDELRVNISSVLEKDYYGALAGGLLFAFVALPKLGLTYTPVLLGAINFLVAAALFWYCRHLIRMKRLLYPLFLLVPAWLIALFVFAQPIILFGEQAQYRDRVIYHEQTPYQKIVLTQWKDDYWLYLNGSEQFSSYDEERYHEPLVHPAMALSPSRRNILLLGAGDGLAAREVLKYSEVRQVTLVDIDPAVTRLAREHPVFTALNEDALSDPRVRIVNQDAYAFLKNTDMIFDVIIVDLPDPKTVSLARLYSREFYRIAARHLTPGGTLITQATSPFFSAKAFLSVLKTMRAAGFAAIPMHNHIPTLGEWGWVLGMNTRKVSPQALKAKASQLQFESLPLKFLNHDAMLSMLNFGKGLFEQLETVEINHELNLIVFQYYQNGRWDLY